MDSKENKRIKLYLSCLSCKNYLLNNNLLNAIFALLAAFLTMIFLTETGQFKTEWGITSLFDYLGAFIRAFLVGLIISVGLLRLPELRSEHYFNHFRSRLCLYGGLLTGSILFYNLKQDHYPNIVIVLMVVSVVAGFIMYSPEFKYIVNYLILSAGFFVFSLGLFVVLTQPLGKIILYVVVILIGHGLGYMLSRSFKTFTRRYKKAK